MEILNKALKEGREKLSEYESKCILASYQIPVTREIVVESSSDVIPAAHEIGYPLVMKGCSPGITHKTERASSVQISEMTRRHWMHSMISWPA